MAQTVRMISINLSSIQKLASVILRQIHRGVSNFRQELAPCPIEIAMSAPSQRPPGRHPAHRDIHWSAQTVAASQPSRAKKHRSNGRETRSLDFGCQRAMFQKYKKTWLDFMGDSPLQSMLANA